MDRTVRDAERFNFHAPLEHWRKVRDRMHATICGLGFDGERNTFTQSFGSSELDASLLLIPLVGFLPAGDPRVRGTVAAIERELLIDGLVLRYRSETDVDGLPPGEGVFLPCSFWLANNYKLQQRDAEHAPCSSACSRCATISACSQRNTIRSRGGSSAISRRRSRISPSSGRP
jgi:GH15 family glucan-1,4-alpha-glucosidase